MIKISKKFQRQFLRVTLAIFVILNLICISQAYHLTHFYEKGSVPTIETQTTGVFNLLKVAFTGLKQSKLPAEARPDSAYQNIALWTKDSIKIATWYVQVVNPKGTVILFHGIGSEKSANVSQCNYFNEKGYSTLLVDFRAHGESDGNTCTIGYNEAEDVRTAYEFVKSKGEKHIILYGISLGAATVTKAIADFEIKPEKVILEMPFASLHRTVEGKMRLAKLPAEPLASLLTFWGGTIHGFWAFKMKPVEFVKKIECPVLLQWGRKDKGVTEKETNDILANIHTSKRLEVYENAGHENLYEQEPEKWEDSVDRFLEDGD